MRQASLWLAVLVLLAAAATAVAKPVELPPFTPEREAAALQFVAQHHAGLSEVLGRLKGLNQEQYQQAIRQLSYESEKLALAKANDPKGYELMLDAWKVKSRIQVLGARLAITSEREPAMEAELKELLYRQIDLQRQTLQHNRERLLSSLKTMEANIQLLEENRDKIVERRLGALTKKTPANPAKK